MEQSIDEYFPSNFSDMILSLKQVDDENADSNDDEFKDLIGGQYSGSSTSNIHMVGKDGGKFQAGLFKSGEKNKTIASKLLGIEFLGLINKYHSNYNKSLPLNACKFATELYMKVINLGVKRSETKRNIMAACYYISCVEHLKYTPSIHDVAKCMNLKIKGFSEGLNYLRSIDIDVDINITKPEIMTLFTHLNLEDDKYEKLRIAVNSIIEISINKHIGIRSIIKSKVAGATFVVLSRAGIKIDNEISEFGVKKNTMMQFVKIINLYHSYFIECYINANINSSRNYEINEINDINDINEINEIKL